MLGESILRERFDKVKNVRRKCKCTWMHERCEPGQELAELCHELYLIKEHTQLDTDKKFWHEVCTELHEHIAYAMEEL